MSIHNRACRFCAFWDSRNPHFDHWSPMSENIQGACRRFPDSKSAMALSVCGEFELADHFPLVRFMETRERHRKHIDVILGDWNRLKKLLAKRNAQIKALKQVSK